MNAAWSSLGRACRAAAVLALVSACAACAGAPAAPGAGGQTPGGRPTASTALDAGVAVPPATRTPLPTLAPRVETPKPHPAPPKGEWTGPVRTAASAHGVRLSVLLSQVTPQLDRGGGPDQAPAEVRSLLAFVAFEAPAADPAARVAPDAAGLVAVDSLGGRYPVVYAELARRPGVTVAAIAVRGAPQQGVRKFSLSAERVRVERGAGPPAVLDGPWEIDLVAQVVDRPRYASTLGFGPYWLEAPGLRVRANCCGSVRGTGIRTWAFAIERPGAPSDDVYGVIGEGDAFGWVAVADGPCVLPWLHATPETFGPPGTRPPTSTPVPECPVPPAVTPVPTPTAPPRAAADGLAVPAS
jgi:hypothetical protein